MLERRAYAQLVVRTACLGELGGGRVCSVLCLGAAVIKVLYLGPYPKFLFHLGLLFFPSGFLDSMAPNFQVGPKPYC